MNEDDKDQGPVDPDRTVYDPAVRAKSDGPTAPADGENGADKGWGSSASAPRREPEPTILARREEQAPDGGRGGPREGAGRFAPRAEGSTIQVGDILNHIFEVKRFIARGGMGEVFEGANVNSDERVAIKVILPSLAADPNVISMFLKEARTLTRVQHEALVSYRVLAQEPQLDVLYIVTEYIDGLNLADALGVITPSPAELTALLRRLASGLRAAHELGAIHRDISPDNVLLQEGKLSRAKIIDFGIAKDLDPGSATIVGDGFAGKLNYVAPEQLGDYDRDIGPWTDVYSLALVILAVAGGRHVSMGGSLVAAVDKRRAGPDLSAAPEALRDLLGRMLKADPAERLRSMEQVLDALDHPAPVVARPKPRRQAPLRFDALPRPALMAGGIAGALVLALGIIFLLPSGGEPVRNDVAPVPVRAVGRDPAELARAAIVSALPQVNCTWLDIVDIGAASGRLAVKMTGVAGSTAQAQAEVIRALRGAGVRADLDFADVAPIQPAGCSALNAFRQIRADEGGHLSTPQRQYEMEILPNGSLASRGIFDLNLGGSDRDFAVFGIEPSGMITMVYPSRAAFLAEAALADGAVEDKDGGRYSLALAMDHQGWSGILLITGNGPFDQAIVSPGMGGRGPDWTERFVTTANDRGWRAEMVWVKSVDERRNSPPPSQPAAATPARP